MGIPKFFRWIRYVKSVRLGIKKTYIDVFLVNVIPCALS